MIKHKLEIAFALIVLFCIISKLPSLGNPHNEGDENIYKALAVNFYETGNYSLQGTAILPSLSKQIYDRPLFHYPPLFMVGIILFYLIDAIDYSVILSWAGHVFLIFAVFIFLRKKFYKTEEDFFKVLLPCVFAATDPILNFISNKIWIDNFAAGLASLGFILFWLAMEKKSYSGVVLAAVVSSMAILSKLPTLAYAPLVLFLVAMFMIKNKPGYKIYLNLFYTFIAITGLLTCPWFLKFYAVFGILIPTWVNPDPWLLNNNAFVRKMTLRPWFYFIKELPLVSPAVAPLILFNGIDAIRKRLSFESVVALIWFFGLLTLFTVQGIRGYTFQMRFLSLLIAPIYILAASGFSVISPKMLWSEV